MGGSSKKKDKSKKRNRSSMSQSGETPEDKKTARRLESADYEESTTQTETATTMKSLEKCIEQVTNQLNEKNDGIVDSVNFISQTIEDMRKELKTTKDELYKSKQIEQEVSALKSQNRELKQRILDMENYS